MTEKKTVSEPSLYAFDNTYHKKELALKRFFGMQSLCVLIIDIVIIPFESALLLHSECSFWVGVSFSFNKCFRPAFVFSSHTRCRKVWNFLSDLLIVFICLCFFSHFFFTIFVPQEQTQRHCTSSVLSAIRPLIIIICIHIRRARVYTYCTYSNVSYQLILFEQGVCVRAVRVQQLYLW